MDTKCTSTLLSRHIRTPNIFRIPPPPPTPFGEYVSMYSGIKNKTTTKINRICTAVTHFYLASFIRQVGFGLLKIKAKHTVLKQNQIEHQKFINSKHVAVQHKTKQLTLLCVTVWLSVQQVLRAIATLLTTLSGAKRVASNPQHIFFLSGQRPED